MTGSLSRWTPLHDAIHDFLPTGTQSRPSEHCFPRENNGYARLPISGAQPRISFSGCILNPHKEMTGFSCEQL
jgi:hypothetical protein